MVEIKPYLKDLYRTNLDENSRQGYLRLDMNESVSGLPEDFVKEIISEISPELLATYPEYKKLKEKIAAHNNLKPENIILANGSDSAIKYIFDAYISSKDKVLLTDPTFAMYPVYCQMFNAEAVIMKYNSDFTFPKEDFLDRIARDLKMLVVINPNNPTGSVLGQGVLEAIIKKASDNDVLAIIDEAYFYFYPYSMIGLVKKYKNLVVLRTFSKLCAMAAARLGYAAAAPQIIEDLKKVKPTFDVNGLAVLFAEKVLDKSDIIANLIASVDEGRKYLAQRLFEEKIGYKEGYANFVLIKCGGRVNEIMEKLAQKNILVAGRFKQGFLKEYIRITVGGRSAMERFCKAFLEVWKH